MDKNKTKQNICRGPGKTFGALSKLNKRAIYQTEYLLFIKYCIDPGNEDLMNKTAF